MTGRILLSLLVFLLMNLTQIQCDTNSSIMSSTWTSEATSSMTSNQPSGTSGSSLASSYTSSPTTPFPSTYVTSPPAQSSSISTMNPSTLVTSPITQSSPMSSMNPSTLMTSPSAQSSPISSMNPSTLMTSPSAQSSPMSSMNPSTLMTSPSARSSPMSSMNPSTLMTSPSAQSSPMSSMNPSTLMTSPMSTMNPSTLMTSPMSTMHPSTYMTSSNVGTSVTIVTTQQQYTTYDLIYQFTVSSSPNLKIGNFTDPTLLNSVQTMVISAFNLTNFNITVIRVEIRSQAKASSSTYQMLTENIFRTTGTSCPFTCIQNSIIKSPPTKTFQLFTNDNGSVPASALSGPTYVSDTSVTTTTAGTYSIGDAPPGVAGKLGMGLGISFIAVLLIAEVIILYRKFGCQPLNRRSQYEMSAYQDNFS